MTKTTLTTYTVRGPVRGTIKQTLAQALHLARTEKSQSLVRAANALIGCPVGGWAETQQAKRRIQDELPLRDQREYTIDQWIDAAYTVDHADRYRSAL